MKFRQFLIVHRKAWISAAVFVLFIAISIYQSIYANEDGIPTRSVYWMLENPIPLDSDATWILPHDGGYLIVTNDGTLACGINAGMSLSFLHSADEPQMKFHACFAKGEDYRILCTEPAAQNCTYSLRTVSADGETLHETVLPESYSAFVDCRMNENLLALVTKTQFLVFSVSDTVRLLYEQAYTGASPQVCITEDTVLFSTYTDQKNTLYEYSIPADTVNTAHLSYAPLTAISAAPDGTKSKYLIGSGIDLLGTDAQFAVIERFLDLRETWNRSTEDSTVSQTLTENSLASVYTDGTVIYITDTHGYVYRFDIFWGDAMQSILS